MDGRAVVLHPGEGIIAHEIHINGEVYKMAIAFMSEDGQMEIQGFEREKASTVFVNGAIELRCVAGEWEYRKIIRGKHVDKG